MTEVRDIESTETKTDKVFHIKLQPEYVSGPYVSAALNPSENEFKLIVDTSKYKILDVGCGKIPRLSWELGPNDLWVGCDPAIDTEESHISVIKSGKHVSTEANLTVFSSTANNVPNFKPDVISIIVPNPEDVADEKIFNEELVNFLDDSKEQKIAIVLEKHSIEGQKYLNENKATIQSWMKEHGFKVSPEDNVWDKFKLNSNYTVAESTRICYTRNSKNLKGTLSKNNGAI